MVERRLLLLNGFLEAPNILVAINFDRKYASRIFAKHPTIQQEQGRRRSTDYCKSKSYREKKVSVLTDRRGLANNMETTTWSVSLSRSLKILSSPFNGHNVFFSCKLRSLTCASRFVSSSTGIETFHTSRLLAGCGQTPVSFSLTASLRSPTFLSPSISTENM